MKNGLLLLGRISLILLAAALVIGITMRLVDANSSNRFTPVDRNTVSQADSVVGNAEGSVNRTGQSATSTAASASEGGEFRGAQHGPRNQTLASRLTFGLFGLVKNSAIIAVVALIIVSVERFFTRRWNNAAV